MFISVANPDLEIQEAPAAHSLQLCPLIQTIILGGELAGDPQSQINFAWPFESQLSLKKRGGGGGGESPGSGTVYICFLVFFSLQQVRLLSATSYELIKGSFFTVKLSGN